ncbi:DUF2867 domain-containing protein [Sneathiella limimaris]|uniref:DUF2867 domain-containing protein n=1 Tax=Sneathiella limimaris TaxID=1964213 RepID=UPI00146B5BB1|nr:DUF2867 domain-containing protein [Sneathiella limimaris]
MAYPSEIPENCSLIDRWRSCSYRDCFSERYAVKSDETAAVLFARVMKNEPWWIRGLMAVRNSVVRIFGLKSETPNADFSEESVRSYKPGDYIGFFLIERDGPEELVVSTNDRHLDAYFSFQIGSSRQEVTLTSTVTTKERFGKLYIFVIAPFHRAIVKYLLSRLTRS